MTMRTLVRIGSLGLLVLLLGAVPQASPEELLRQGNAAFAREEYEAALQLYTRAEETTTDPGLVAYNKGTALYRLGRYRDAQLHFLRCLEESDAVRRPALYYNLGNCLLHQAQAGGDLALFREAMAAYEHCLRQENITPALQENARYNLELAKLLWLQARLTRSEPETTPNSEQQQPNQQPPKAKDQPEKTKTDDGSDPNPSAKPNPKDTKEPKGQLDEKKGMQTPLETEMTTPGRGNVQPPRDDAKLSPLAPEDALKNLEAAAERIRRERSAYMLRLAPVPSRGVPDW